MWVSDGSRKMYVVTHTRKAGNISMNVSTDIYPYSDLDSTTTKTCLGVHQ